MDQKERDKLLMELFPSQSTVVTTPRGDDFIDTSLLHPELAKMTLSDILNQTTKGRLIMEKVESAKNANIERTLFLSMANLLREPIMQFCEKPGFPTRNEQRVFLKHLFDPYPILSLQMFVSNKKQQSGLLENSIRNARRRAKKSDDDSDSDIKEDRRGQLTRSPTQQLRKKRKSTEKAQYSPEIPPILFKLASRLPENGEDVPNISATQIENMEMSARLSTKLCLVSRLAKELKELAKTTTLAQKQDGKMAEISKVMKLESNDDNALAPMSYKDEGEEDQFSIPTGLTKLLGLAEKHLALKNKRFDGKTSHLEEEMSTLNKVASIHVNGLDTDQKTSGFANNIQFCNKLSDLCSPCSSNDSLDRFDDLETSSKKNVKLSKELLDITIEGLLNKTPSGLAVLHRLESGNDLQRPDYLYMANMIREPIMKLCERPNYPSRYEQRAFLEHLFQNVPQVDIPTFVGNRKQTLGCLENSIRNGRRSKKMKDTVKEEVERPDEFEENPQKLKKALVMKDNLKLSSNDPKVRQVARYQRHSDVTVGILHPEIRKLTIEHLLGLNHKGQILLAMLEAKLPLPSVDCAKLALMIREPIMNYAETPNRPSRVELRAYFQHLLGKYPQLEMTDFVCNRKQIHGHLEKSIRNAKRVINKKAARTQITTVRNASMTGLESMHNKVLVLPDLTTIQLPSSISVQPKPLSTKHSQVIKKKRTGFESKNTSTLLKTMPEIGAGSPFAAGPQNVVIKPMSNRKMDGTQVDISVNDINLEFSANSIKNEGDFSLPVHECLKTSRKEDKAISMTSKIPVESYDLHENLKELTIQNLLESTLPGRILLHQIEDRDTDLKKQELTEFCKFIRDPLMRFCEREFYPRRHEMRAFLMHLFQPYPKMMNYMRDLVCDKKQILGILEDNIHCVRRRLRGKGVLPPPGLEPNLDKSFVSQSKSEEVSMQSIEESYEACNPTNMLLQAAMNAIHMQETIQL